LLRWVLELCRLCCFGEMLSGRPCCVGGFVFALLCCVQFAQTRDVRRGRLCVLLRALSSRTGDEGNGGRSTIQGPRSTEEEEEEGAQGRPRIKTGPGTCRAEGAKSQGGGVECVMVTRTGESKGLLCVKKKKAKDDGRQRRVRAPFGGCGGILRAGGRCLLLSRSLDAAGDWR